MASIYNISSDLLELFQVIEDQEGEITEEQEKLLEIKEEELSDKLQKYAQAVRQFELDINSCKEEEKRIKARRDIYTKRIERLKKVMLDAVQVFGKETKSGSKYIELPTMRLGTRNSTSVTLDEYREQEIIDRTIQYVDELMDEGIFDIDNFDMEGFLQALNANYKAEFDANPFNADKEFIPITANDLISIKCKFVFDGKLIDLLRNEPLIAEHNATYIDSSCECNTSKTEMKEILNDKKVTFAELNNNVSLTMK